MSLSFVEHFEAIARRIVRRRRAAVALWALAALVTAMAALIAIDWSLGVWRLVPRLALTSSFVLGAIGILGRAVRSRGVSMTPLHVAMQLERLHPEHRGLLSSGVEFSREDDADPTAGSADLRRAVVLRAAVAAESLDAAVIIPRAPLRRAATAGAVAAAICLLAAGFWPQGLAAGVVRLTNPFSDAEYPRQHHLQFEEPPTMLAIGADFKVALRDRNGQLPERVRVDYRFNRRSGTHYESQDYAATGEALVVSRPNIHSSFEYRAHGGDHLTMPWRHVTVVPAPEITSLQISVDPPPYTDMNPYDSDDPVRLLEGSRLALRGNVNTPIASAELHFENERIPLATSTDGLSFHTLSSGWQPATSGHASISLSTRDGLTATANRRIQVNLIPDRPPTVEIVRPTETLAVLPEAVIDVVLAADDDLAVRTIGLALEPSDGAASARYFELYRGGESPERGPREARYALELSPLTLRAGTAADIYGTAEDYAGRQGRTVRPVRVRIIAREEFVRRVDAMQSQLHGALVQAANRQQSALEQVNDWRQAGAPPPDMADARSTLAAQRQVAQALTGSRESAAQLSASLLEELQRNRWSDVEIAARMAKLTERLHALADRELPAAESALNQFAAGLPPEAGSPTPAPVDLPDALRDALDQAQTHQTAVMDVLQETLRELADWGHVQQLQQALAGLSSQQSALAEETQTLGREALEQSGDEAQRLRRTEDAARRQRQLAGELAAAMDQARQSADALAATDPANAARLQDAAASGEQGQAPTEARNAAEHLANQRYGQAADSQRKTGEQLQKMLDQLSKGRGPLDRLDAALKRLVAEQGALVADLDQAIAGDDNSSAATLAHRQGIVRNKTITEADASAEFPLFARLLRQAAGTMQKAENEFASGEIDRHAAELAQQAHLTLRQLAEAVHAQAQQRLAPEQPPGQPSGAPPEEKVSPEQLQAMQLTVAQLALLRTLQADLQRRTEELEHSTAADQVDEAAQLERGNLLAVEQRELELMTEELIRAASKLPVDNDSSEMNEP